MAASHGDLSSASGRLEVESAVKSDADAGGEGGTFRDAPAEDEGNPEVVQIAVVRNVLAAVLTRFHQLCRSPAMSADSWKMWGNALKLLYACDYTADELCTTLAHASQYFLDLHERVGIPADAVGRIIVLLVFMAHSYVLDETCELSLWHHTCWRGVGSLQSMNAALIRLMRLRGYVLRVPQVELQRRYAILREEADVSFS